MVELFNLIMKLIANFIVFVLKLFETLFRADIVLTLFIVVAFVAGIAFGVTGAFWTFLFALIAVFGFSAYSGTPVNVLDDYTMVINRIKDIISHQQNTSKTTAYNNYYTQNPPVVTNNQPPTQPPVVMPQPPIQQPYMPPQPPIQAQPPQPPYIQPQPPVQPPMQPPIPSQPGFKINKKSSSWTSKGREENAIVDVEALLTERIKSQDVAIKSVINGLKRAAVSSSKSKLSFLLTGPTGTGKTEMVKLVGDGLKRPFRKYDMGNYKDKEQLWQLLGSPQGYIGGEGKLTQFVKNNPNAVLLFDEIEKATPEIYDFMLPMLDGEGVRDNRSDEAIPFDKTIVFFTTNLVTSTPAEAKEDPEVVRNLIENQKFLRPELLARIKTIVPFFEFGQEDVLEIVAMQMESYLSTLVDPNRVGISCDDDVIEFVGSKVDKKYGARNITQNIERYIGNSLTEQLFQRGQKVSSVKISVESDSIKVEVQ